jgi:hypothetical protein
LISKRRDLTSVLEAPAAWRY